MFGRKFHTQVGSQLFKATRKTFLKDGPKKPLAVYSLFTKDMYHEVKAQNPGKSFGEISKLINVRWKNLSESQKKPFYDEAAKLKNKYDMEKAEFEKTLPPKRPASGYILYLKDVHAQIAAENPGVKQSELVKQISSKWNSLSDSMKAKYRDRYQNELENWRANKQ